MARASLLKIRIAMKLIAFYDHRLKGAFFKFLAGRTPPSGLQRAMEAVPSGRFTIRLAANQAELRSNLDDLF